MLLLHFPGLRLLGCFCDFMMLRHSFWPSLHDVILLQGQAGHLSSLLQGKVSLPPAGGWNRMIFEVQFN